MASYRFRFFRNGEFAYQANHQHKDDLDALKSAEALAAKFDVQVWRSNRFVAHVNLRIAKFRAPAWTILSWWIPLHK